METKTKLPSIQELHSDIEMKIKENAFNVLMNYPPKNEWIKKHPMGNYYYLPVERVEWLLTTILINWHVEVKDVSLIANSIVVTIRLHYKHPVSGEIVFQDGIGASPLQTDEGAGATEFNKMKFNAVQLAAPSAESYALKDAAEKIGRLFGKDINRKDVMNYNIGEQFTGVEIKKLQKELSDLIQNCKNEELRDQVMDAVMIAEEDGENTAEFYRQQIEKLQKNG